MHVMPLGRDPVKSLSGEEASQNGKHILLLCHQLETYQLTRKPYRHHPLGSASRGICATFCRWCAHMAI